MRSIDNGMRGDWLREMCEIETECDTDADAIRTEIAEIDQRRAHLQRELRDHTLRRADVYRELCAVDAAIGNARGALEELERLRRLAGETP